MATLNEKTVLSRNPHLLNRISGALSVAAEDVKNEQQDFTAIAATDIFTATAHGYADGDKIELAGVSLPSGVIAGEPYFIRDQTTNTFKLANTSGGVAIDLTVDGHGRIAVEHHPSRFVWASSVLLVQDGPRNEAVRSIWLVIQNSTIADGYVASPSNGGSVTDSDVQFVINGLINFLAGAET